MAKIYRVIQIKLNQLVFENNHYQQKEYLSAVTVTNLSLYFVYCDGLGRLYLYLYLFVFMCCVFVLLPIFRFFRCGIVSYHIAFCRPARPSHLRSSANRISLILLRSLAVGLFVVVGRGVRQGWRAWRRRCGRVVDAGIESSALDAAPVQSIH